MKAEREETPLKIDRFFVNIPSEVVHDFLVDMNEQMRSAGELAAYIVLQHYRAKKRRALQQINVAPFEGEPMPKYGPKPAQTSNESVEQSRGEV